MGFEEHLSLAALDIILLKFWNKTVLIKISYIRREIIL